METAVWDDDSDLELEKEIVKMIRADMRSGDAPIAFMELNEDGLLRAAKYFVDKLEGTGLTIRDDYSDLTEDEDDEDEDDMWDEDEDDDEDDRWPGDNDGDDDDDERAGK